MQEKYKCNKIQLFDKLNIPLFLSHLILQHFKKSLQTKQKPALNKVGIAKNDENTQ
jgi:hypothetical protein